MILYGQYTVELDAAGRWVVPEPFAAALAKGAVVTAGLDGCLWLYPRGNWQSFVERVSPSLALTNATAREFARQVFGRADALQPHDGSPSGKDAMKLPKPLRQLAAIQGEMVLVGMVDHLELWSPERWAAQLARADPIWEARLATLGVLLRTRSREEMI